MDFAKRKLYYNRCNPDEALAPGDGRNVDLDSFGVRGDVWVDRLADRIELSNQPSFELFTGLPGSGKSTELRRLAAHLQDPERAHLYSVLINAEDVIDLNSEIDIPDVIAIVVASAEAAVLVLEGKDPERALEDGYLKRLWDWLTRTDVELTKVEYAIPAGPKLIGEIKTRPPLRKRVRSIIASHLTRFLAEAREELKSLNGRVVGKGYSGLVVIFDSLEKLRGISTNWREVLDSAERMFAAGAPFLRLPVHVIYTIPAALVARRFEQVHFMPMIKLRAPGGALFAPGVDAAKTLVRKRVPAEVLAEVLGPSAEARLDQIVAWSGGYPREIVRLIQNLFTVKKTPVEDSDLQSLWSELRDAYREIVPADAFEWLAHLAHDHHLTPQNEDHRRVADLMLANNVILRYRNERVWYDLHPAVYEIPGVQQARAALGHGGRGKASG